jgi:uncharacterized membrane protein required for colicin V production
MTAEIVDMILIFLFIIAILGSVNRGFIRTVLSLASWLVSFALAGALSTALAGPVYGTFFETAARENITERIGRGTDSAHVLETARTVLETLPDSVVRLAEFAELNTEELAAALPTQSFTVNSAAETLETLIVRPVALSAVRWGLSLLFFAVLFALTRKVAVHLSKINRLPIVKQGDKILGFILGLGKGAIVTFVLALLLQVGATVLGPDHTFSRAVAGSRTVEFLLTAMPVRRGL